MFRDLPEHFFKISQNKQNRFSKFFRPLHYPPLKTSLVPETKQNTLHGSRKRGGNVEITELGSSPRLPKIVLVEKSISRKIPQKWPLASFSKNFPSTSKRAKPTHIRRTDQPHIDTPHIGTSHTYAHSISKHTHRINPSRHT